MGVEGVDVGKQRRHHGGDASAQVFGGEAVEVAAERKKKLGRSNGSGFTQRDRLLIFVRTTEIRFYLQIRWIFKPNGKINRKSVITI